MSQLADAGTVKVFSSGSALDDGPALYLHSPNEHGHAPTFREIASFNPFDGTSGTRVATTSTTTGAHLLVSGVAAGPRRKRYEVRVRQAARPGDDAASPASRRSLFRWQVRSRPYSAATKRLAELDHGRPAGFWLVNAKHWRVTSGIGRSYNVASIRLRNSAVTAGVMPNHACQAGMPWCSSMPSPVTVRLPRSRAAAINGVSRGM